MKRFQIIIILLLLFCFIYNVHSQNKKEREFLKVTLKEIPVLYDPYISIIRHHINEMSERGIENSDDKVILLRIGMDSHIQRLCYFDTSLAKNIESLYSNIELGSEANFLMYDVVAATYHIGSPALNRILHYLNGYYYLYVDWNVVLVSDFNLKVETNDKTKELILLDRRKTNYYYDITNNLNEYCIYGESVIATAIRRTVLNECYEWGRNKSHINKYKYDLIQYDSIPMPRNSEIDH